MRAEFVAPPKPPGVVKLELTLDEAIVLAEILGSDSQNDAATRIKDVGSGRSKNALRVLKQDKTLHYDMYDKLDEVLKGAKQ